MPSDVLRMSVAVFLALLFTGVRLVDVLIKPEQGRGALSVQPTEAEKRRTLQAYAGFDAYPSAKGDADGGSRSTAPRGGRPRTDPSAPDPASSGQSTANLSTASGGSFGLPMWLKRSFERAGVRDWLSLRLIRDGLGPRELTPPVGLRGTSLR